MSRIGKKQLTLPTNVTLTTSGKEVVVKGPKGELKLTLHSDVSVNVQDGVVTVSVIDPENIDQRALWGTFGSLLRNMVTGVSEGYKKQLEVNGVGFKVALKGTKLELALGFSHPVVFEIPKGITAKVEANLITLEGADKHLLGQTAASIRGLREPEPYKGKGIKYLDETIRRKAGKSAASA